MDDVLDVFNVEKKSKEPSLEELENMMMMNRVGSGGEGGLKEGTRLKEGSSSNEGGGEGSMPMEEEATKEGERSFGERLFSPMRDDEQINITEEPGYRKDIYEADFVDFDNDFCRTPRIIRPRTEAVEVSRPGTSVSWVSSVPSNAETEVVEEVPLDTWVDEPRLPNAFEKVREKFVMEADSHGDSCEKLEELKLNLILENEVNVVQREQLKKVRGWYKLYAQPQPDTDTLHFAHRRKNTPA